MTPLASLCTVNRDYVRVIDQALQFAGITPTLIPDPGRSTHYIVQVAEEDVDRAADLLKQRGMFVPPEEQP